MGGETVEGQEKADSGRSSTLIHILTRNSHTHTHTHTHTIGNGRNLVQAILMALKEVVSS